MRSTGTLEWRLARGELGHTDPSNPDISSISVTGAHTSTANVDIISQRISTTDGVTVVRAATVVSSAKVADLVREVQCFILCLIIFPSSW